MACPEVQAQHEWGVRQLRSQSLDAAAWWASVSVPITTRAAPSSSSSLTAATSVTPASTITRASRARAATTSAVERSAGDRVEIGHIELVEADRFADRARDLDRVGAGDDLAVQRAIAFALPAHGVHGGSALEIDDWDHSH